MEASNTQNNEMEIRFDSRSENEGFADVYKRQVPENIVIRIWQTRCLRLQEILLETVEKRCMIHFLILFSQQHAREDMQPV